MRNSSRRQSRGAALPFLSRWLALALISSPSFAGPAPAPIAAPPIRVLTAWIRWLPAGLPAAGYLTFTNTGQKTIELVGASSVDYGDVSIHRSVIHGTTEEMVPVDRIALQPGRTLRFETTGYHLMLTKPAAEADSCSSIPITLSFAGGASITVPFEVRKNPAANESTTPH